ncbi:MAG: A/G-specific adenine glycosylase, partial [Deltaproteobacteria bacterium]|nr:A/G-specific adenine glycosylase [Deltaproteobacteria bacterium]
VWIAETMLQQTRSETVLRYYPRFLERFPTLGALARASESAVLATWSGLGYYARARNLRRAARRAVARHGGRLPADPRLLARLPGIGRYTAGAVASIGFGVPAPLVDGNVARVLARCFEVAGPLRSPSVERRLWALAEALVHPRRPGDWNQALMELGATVCTARAPACSRCPLRAACGARRHGSVERFPEPPPRPPTERVRRACLVLRHADRVLLVRRREGRRLRGLWEFPWVDASPPVRPQAAARRALCELGAGGAAAAARATVRHAIVNQRIETVVFEARLARRPEPPSRGDARWARWRDLGRLPLSAVGLRVRGLLAEPSTKGGKRGRESFCRSRKRLPTPLNRFVK